MTEKIKYFFHTFYRELLFFILFAFTLLSTLPDELHGWNSGWYAMDYSLGFDSRLFIGSLLRLFYPNFLPASAVYTFVLLSLIFLLALLAYVLGYALRRFAGSVSETGLLVLIALYLLCPGSPAYLWSAENMGRFDMYLLLITLIAGIVYLHVHSATVCLVLYTVCGLVALSIHQGYFFTFFPLLLTLYILTVTSETKNNSRHLTAAFLCIGILGAAFLYFQFFSHIHAVTCEQLVAALRARTDLVLNESALRYEYFSGIAKSAQDLVLNQLGERIRYGIVTLLLLSPLAAVYGWFWFHLLKAAFTLSHRQTPSGKKCSYTNNLLLLRHLPILLSQLLFLPAFILTIDWGRWFGAFLTVQALQIIFLAVKKDASTLSALEKLHTAIRKHPILFLCTALWLGNLHKFQATLLPDAPIFFASLYKLFRIVF